MLKVTVKIKGLDSIKRKLNRLANSDIPKAATDALNDTAFVARRAMQDEMRRVFDRVTPYVIRSVQVKKATEQNLVATVAPTYMGGKGVDPQNILAAEVSGGKRNLKRSEKALEAVGILPKGWHTVIPKNPFPGSDDGRGNIRGPFMVRLLSYFHAFGEQGYSMNMTEKTRKRVHKVGRSEGGYKTINGVMFFVSYGGMRSDRAASKHLHPGIWAKTGIHGVNVRPVLLFIKRTPRYHPRLIMHEVARKANIQQVFEKRLRYRLRRIIERAEGAA